MCALIMLCLIAGMVAVGLAGSDKAPNTYDG